MGDQSTQDFYKQGNNLSGALFGGLGRGNADQYGEAAPPPGWQASKDGYSPPEGYTPLPENWVPAWASYNGGDGGANGMFRGYQWIGPGGGGNPVENQFLFDPNSRPANTGDFFGVAPFSRTGEQWLEDSRYVFGPQNQLRPQGPPMFHFEGGQMTQPNPFQAPEGFERYGDSLPEFSGPNGQSAKSIEELLSMTGMQGLTGDQIGNFVRQNSGNQPLDPEVFAFNTPSGITHASRPTLNTMVAQGRRPL